MSSFAHLGGTVERGEPACVGGIDVGAALDEQASAVEAARLHRVHQRRRALRRPRIHGRAAIEQPAQHVGVA